MMNPLAALGCLGLPWAALGWLAGWPWLAGWLAGCIGRHTGPSAKPTSTPSARWPWSAAEKRFIVVAGRAVPSVVKEIERHFSIYGGACAADEHSVWRVFFPLPLLGFGVLGQFCRSPTTKNTTSPSHTHVFRQAQNFIWQAPIFMISKP